MLMLNLTWIFFVWICFLIIILSAIKISSPSSISLYLSNFQLLSTLFQFKQVLFQLLLVLVLVLPLVLLLQTIILNQSPLLTRKSCLLLERLSQLTNLILSWISIILGILHAKFQENHFTISGNSIKQMWMKLPKKPTEKIIDTTYKCACMNATILVGIFANCYQFCILNYH